MKSWTIGIVLMVIILVSGLGIGLWSHHIEWIQAIIIFFTLYGISLLSLSVLFREKTYLRNDCYRPFVSILIPAHNEENVIEDTIESIFNMSYNKNKKPNFEIIVIDDGSTDRTGLVLKNLQVRFSKLKVLTRKGDKAGRGKPAALNEALKIAEGEIIGVFDADTHVHPDFLKEAVSRLFGSKVAGVQGRVRIYNAKDNFLTGFQNDEFSILYHLMQRGRELLGGMTCLGGNGQLTKKEALLEVGGWNELSTTEDIDLTLKLLIKGKQIRYCSKAILWQEGIDNFKCLLRQRIRWVDGLFKCIFDYFFPLIFGQAKLTSKIDGVISLSRVTIPLWIIMGNLYVIFSLILGFNIYSYVPANLCFILTLSFFSVMWIGVIKEEDKFSIIGSNKRVLRYWLCSFIWLIAAPIAFFKLFNYTQTIMWDKTFHKGSLSENKSHLKNSGSIEKENKQPKELKKLLPR